MIKVHSLSFSSANQYSACPSRLYYEKILRLPRRRSTTQKQLFGIALHSALSSYWKSVSMKIPFDLDILVNVFKIKFDSWPSADLVPDEEGNKDVYAEARTLLEQFLAIDLHRNIVAVEAAEKPMEFALTSTLNIISRPDLIVRDRQGLCLIEWKSSSKGYSQEQIRKVTEQLLLSALAFNEPCSGKAYLFLRKKKPEVQEIPIDFDSIEYDEIIERFTMVAKAIENGIFYRNRSWMCNSGCPYAYVCSSEKSDPDIEQEYKEAA